MIQVGVSHERDKSCGILQKMKTQATLHLGVLEGVHHQFSGFGVPIEGMMKLQFLELRLRIAFLYVVRFPCFDERRQRHHGEIHA
jgi:hypothetical protein